MESRLSPSPSALPDAPGASLAAHERLYVDEKFPAGADLLQLIREIDAFDERARSLFTAPMMQARDDLIVVVEAALPKEICRFEYLCEVSALVRDICVDSLASNILRLYCAPAVLFEDKLNCKVPGAGGFGPHQGFAACRHFPPSLQHHSNDCGGRNDAGKWLPKHC
jgi:hypothetical protein